MYCAYACDEFVLSSSFQRESSKVHSRYLEIFRLSPVDSEIQGSYASRSKFGVNTCPLFRGKWFYPKIIFCGHS